MRISYFHEFEVLTEKLSFSAAAKELNISQSTLSKHISALEKDLDTVLLNRTTQLVSLTSEGDQFLDTCRIITSAYHHAQQSLSQQKNLSKALIVGGLVDSPGEFSVISRAVQIRTGRSSEAPVHFVPVSTTSIRTQLAEGIIDCALTSYDYAQAPEKEKQLFRYEPLAHMPFLAIMEKDHPLANKESLRLRDLDGHTLIRLTGPRSHAGWTCIQSQLTRYSVSVETQLYSIYSLNDYINIDLHDCIFILPGIEMRHDERHHPNRVVLPFEDETAFFKYGLLYPKSTRKLDAIISLEKAIRAIIATGETDDLMPLQ